MLFFYREIPVAERNEENFGEDGSREVHRTCNLVKSGKAATGSACYSGRGVKAPIKVLAVRLR